MVFSIIIIIIAVILILARPVLVRLLTLIIRPIMEKIARKSNMDLTKVTHTNLFDMTEEEIKIYFQHGILLGNNQKWWAAQTKNKEWANFFYTPGLPVIISLGKGYIANRKTGELRVSEPGEIVLTHEVISEASNELASILSRIDAESIQYKKDIPKGLGEYIEHTQG